MKKILRKSRIWWLDWCTTLLVQTARGSTASCWQRAGISAKAVRSDCGTRSRRSSSQACSLCGSFTHSLPKQKVRDCFPRATDRRRTDTPFAARAGISVALKKLFQFLHQTTQALAEIPRAEAALRLYLQCAQAASDCNLEPVTYEFMERAYEIFEESIPGVKQKQKHARSVYATSP